MNTEFVLVLVVFCVVVVVVVVLGGCVRACVCVCVVCVCSAHVCVWVCACAWYENCSLTFDMPKYAHGENSSLTCVNKAGRPKDIYFLVTPRNFLWWHTHRESCILLWHRRLLPFFSLFWWAHTSCQHISVYVLSSFRCQVWQSWSAVGGSKWLGVLRPVNQYTCIRAILEDKGRGAGQAKLWLLWWDM